MNSIPDKITGVMKLYICSAQGSVSWALYRAEGLLLSDEPMEDTVWLLQSSQGNTWVTPTNLLVVVWPRAQ